MDKAAQQATLFTNLSDEGLSSYYQSMIDKINELGKRGATNKEKKSVYVAIHKIETEISKRKNNTL